MQGREFPPISIAEYKIRAANNVRRLREELASIYPIDTSRSEDNKLSPLSILETWRKTTLGEEAEETPNEKLLADFLKKNSVPLEKAVEIGILWGTCYGSEAKLVSSAPAEKTDEGGIVFFVAVNNNLEIRATGPAGIGALISALKRSSIDEEARNKTEEALTYARQAISDLLSQGGIVTGKGKIFTLSDISLHPKLKAELEEGLFFSYQGLDIRDRWHFPLSQLGIKPTEKVMFIKEGFDTHLEFYEGSTMTPHYVIEDERKGHLFDLEEGLANYILNIYRKGNIRPVIRPVTAARQILFETANEKGLGKIGFELRRATPSVD